MTCTIERVTECSIFITQLDAYNFQRIFQTAVHSPFNGRTIGTPNTRDFLADDIFFMSHRKGISLSLRDNFAADRGGFLRRYALFIL